jgi:hypothetical protein
MDKKTANGLFDFFATLISAAIGANLGTLLARTYDLAWYLHGLAVMVLFLLCYGAARLVRSKLKRLESHEPVHASDGRH